MRKIPSSKQELYVVVEGYADKETIKRIIKNLDLKFDVRVVDAGGKDKIISKYRSLKAMYSESEIVVLYDLDGKRNIDDILATYKNKQVKIDRKNIYFINPAIEFLWYIARKKSAIKWNRKNQFSKFIMDEFNIFDYQSTKKQVNSIIKQITDEDVLNMFNNIDSIISDDDLLLPATNIMKFIQKITKKEKALKK